MTALGLAVDPEIWRLFPGMRIALVRAAGIDNRSPNPAAARAWREAWAAAGALDVPNAQSHPRVAPWREALRAAGSPPKKYPAAIESLLRRALKGGDPFSINPLVDFYNAVSLRHVSPAGGFDLGAVAGPPRGSRTVELRLTRPGDRFHPLGGEATEEVPAGEVAYCDGSDVLTRHFVWRQSEKAAIRPETTEVLLMSEVLAAIEPGVVAAVLDDLATGLREHFGVDVEAGVLAAD